MRRAVFLDRDGVLNRAYLRGGSPVPPASLHELELLNGVGDACQALKNAGLLLIVVTNQPDVARGTQCREAVEQINQAIESRLPIDEVKVCYHDAADGCLCRKPLPGMLLEAARDWQLDLKKSFMVGDRWKDIEAGRRAGCKTVFIDYGYEEKQPFQPDKTVGGLSEAAHWILSVISSQQEGSS